MADIGNLRAFLEAASLGSFVAASEQLHLSHSSVSARIRALEDEIGARLFHRGRHGVTLNEAGKSLLPFAENITRTWAQAGTSVRAIAAGNIPVRAGVQQDLWDTFGADWFALLRVRVPDLQLHLTADTSTRLCERVSQQLLDLAVIFEPRRASGAVLKPVAELTLRLTAKRPAQWGGRLPGNYFYVDWGPKFEDWHGGQFGRGMASAFNVEVAGIALSVLQREGGMAYFPEEFVAPLIQSGELFFVSDAPCFSITMNMASLQSSNPTKLLQLAESSLKDVIEMKQAATSI